MRLIVRHERPIELILAQGRVSIGSAEGDSVCIDDAGLLPAHAVFQWGFDGRLLFLRLAAGARAHVNGRPVSELAILRAGDAITLQHVPVDVLSDQVSLLDLQGALAQRSHVPAGPKIVLRCVAGAMFGQSFAMREPIALLSGTRMQSGPSDSTSAVTLYWLGDHALVLAGADALDIEINGYVGRAGCLHAGDQLRVGDLRFALEAPGVVSRRSGRHDAITPVYGQRILEQPSIPETPSVRVETQQASHRGLLVTLAMAGLIAVILLALLLFVPH